MLSACSLITPKPTIKPVIIRQVPPVEWLQPCPKPELTGHTNQELLTLTTTALAVIDQCNADKAAIKQWSESESSHE
ncbi:hypothetical protein H0A36_25810 [Endozoicomonas sp. SM1973]|uniref:Peptidase n=1 Tax=Spartinivicinus marinus TaxID=2994442 RepID=A0A853INL3_9GAMM|nr:hypothetical protein [Spartinivicinus marinus]MCX4030282.1 hypothetical protein [Spartinivicinus marinus]MCX4030415.1 hypothetical protein [Spartinivicinus marinus]NYZ69436.1 hypothetical protein [Spartinivicinus marinus]